DAGAPGGHDGARLRARAGGDAPARSGDPAGVRRRDPPVPAPRLPPARQRERAARRAVVRRAWPDDARGRVKTVVVTGAGSGIGRATARAFAQGGARLAVCDVDQPRLDALARELGDRALVVRRVDVADRAQMAAFADEVHRQVAAADVVVNNAGVGLGGSFLDTSLDDWDWVLGVNL